MKNTKGISLIVLVITIIIMIILAGAVVLTLNGRAVVDNATGAVDNTNLATVKELASIAWGEAYANGATTDQSLQDAVDKALEENNIDKDAYGVYATTNGLTIGWIQDGLIVKKGSTVLKVGDIVNYDAGIDTYTSTWQVLGAEDGQLLIMSTADIAYYGLSGEEDYIKGVSKLNDLCAPYGSGKGAVGARSITVNDVNRVTGYNVKAAAYGKGKEYEYGNKVTYWWTGNENPYYTSTNGAKGNVTDSHNGSFKYFNGTNFVTSTAPDDATQSAPVKIVTVTADYYNYYGTTLTTSDDDELKGLAASSKEYIMLFRNSANTSYSDYWLASSCIGAYSFSIHFNIRYVGRGGVYGHHVACSYGARSSISRGVRAVVSLAANIQLTGSSETSWSF